MIYRNRDILDERVQIDGVSFVNCKVDGCELLFAGTAPPNFVDCWVTYNRFSFNGDRKDPKAVAAYDELVAVLAGHQGL